MIDSEQVSEWASELYFNYSTRLRDVGNLFISFNPAQRHIVEDAVQEVFCVLIKKADSLMKHENIQGWLLCTLRLKLREQFRIHKRDLKHMSFSFDDEGAYSAISNVEKNNSIMDGLTFVLNQDQFKRIEDLLGKDNAKLFLMYCVNKESAKVVSEEFGISENAVWVRANRIRRKLLDNKSLFLTVLLFYFLQM